MVEIKTGIDDTVHDRSTRDRVQVNGYWAAMSGVRAAGLLKINFSGVTWKSVCGP